MLTVDYFKRLFSFFAFYYKIGQVIKRLCNVAVLVVSQVLERLLLIDL